MEGGERESDGGTEGCEREREREMKLEGEREGRKKKDIEGERWREREICKECEYVWG